MRRHRQRAAHRPWWSAPAALLLPLVVLSLLALGPAAAAPRPVVAEAATGWSAVPVRRAAPTVQPVVLRGQRPDAARPALPQPGRSRQAGLPVAVAVVALAGSASLLARTLRADRDRALRDRATQVARDRRPRS